MRQNIALYLASMLCPGVVWATKGYVTRAVLTNIGFVLAWILYFLIWIGVKFYPVAPTVWFVIWWLFLLYLNARDAARAPMRRDVPLSSFGNAVLSMVSWFAPLVFVVATFFGQFGSAVMIQSGSMFPTIVPGDVLWIDRGAYDMRWPERGDVVLYRGNEDGRVQMGRVIGLPGDLVGFENGDLYTSESEANYTPIDEPFASQFARSTGYPPEYVRAKYEVLNDTVYPIADAAESQSSHAFDSKEWHLGEHEIFVLNDNRGHLDDSRALGPIEHRQLIGMPLYVLWNTATDKRLRNIRSGSVLQYPRFADGRQRGTDAERSSDEDTDDLLEKLKDD